MDVYEMGYDPIELTHMSNIHDKSMKLDSMPDLRAVQKRVQVKSNFPAINIIPDRIKGSVAQTYGRQRDPISRQIIAEQVTDISEKFFKGRAIEFDPDNGNWVVFVEYLLPKRWKGVAKESPLLISFPMEYPRLPPVGFYLRKSLPGSPNGHLYKQQYDHVAAIADPEPIKSNWLWYCVYIESGNWKPAPFRYSGDWKKGDNLWDYMTLIGEVLQSDD